MKRLAITADEKEQLVHLHTDGRTTRSSQMTVKEADALIYNLRFFMSDELVRDRKRKRVIAVMKEAGYRHADGRADMDAIHDWVMKQKFKKHMNAHTINELSSLIYAAEQVRDHYLAKVNHHRNTAEP